MKRMIPILLLSVVLTGCSLPFQNEERELWTIDGTVVILGDGAITYSGGHPSGQSTLNGDGEFIDNGCSAPLVDLDTEPELYGAENTLISTGRITQTSHVVFDNGSTNGSCLFNFTFEEVEMSSTFTVKLNAFMEERNIPRDELICNDIDLSCILLMRNIELS